MTHNSRRMRTTLLTGVSTLLIAGTAQAQSVTTTSDTSLSANQSFNTFGAVSATTLGSNTN
ncbi:outer membrane biogenesis lipoprotein LolB, partial [Novosphingobium hassiacum]